MKIDCISDLHGFLPELPGGDLLIVAGDLTANDTLDQINRLKDWLWDLGTNHYKKIAMIGGNHDNWIQRREFFNQDTSSWEHHIFSYLEDSGTEFEGLKIWGSPWTKRFEGENPNATAFTCETEEELAEKWALIPEDTDILVTHSPAFWYGDKTITGMPVGSATLRKRIRHISLREQTIKLHVFGHIHEAYGSDYGDATVFHRINASHVNERYEPVNKPVRVEL